MSLNKKHIMLVDGMALLFRGFFATSFRGNFMRNVDGIPTNGVYQFLKYFLDAVEKFQPTHVVVCWDMGSKTFRTEKYEQYKANRDAPPEELIPQFDLVKEIVTLLNTPNIGLENYEADDCIGTLACHYKDEGQVTILTGDQDILQLVSDHVQVAIMRKGIGNYEVFTKDNFYEKLELTPQQIIDLKGLMGDSADNYPGVKGIGEKTALKLLKQYETIDNLLLHKDELTKGLQNKLDTNLEMLYLSRDLAEIKCDVDISCELSTEHWSFDAVALKEELETLKYHSLAKLFN